MHRARSVVIRTPDHRLRVFVSSALRELAEERQAVREAIVRLRLAPVMFESGARPHPARKLYRAYLLQSHIFIGIYWQSYGWIAPDMQISGLEDEYSLSTDLPCLFYIKDPAPRREPALTSLLERIERENSGCYKSFSTTDELTELVENDLILLLTEYFETVSSEKQVSRELAQRPLTNVPVPRNPLIGREQELAAACDLLMRNDVGLVTLTGAGGVGKSRLGIQVAVDLRDRFPDGVYMVALETISDPDLVIPTIAETLGVTETTGKPPTSQSLREHICNKRMLLLLDNFEQVLPAGPRIAELLEACPGAKILVTSRSPLRLRPEKELPVTPLAVPPLEATPDLQRLSQYPAVRLFIERAQAVKPDFQVTRENAPVVAEVCHRLDGLPLAIELASARIRMLSPHGLLIRMQRRFEVLRGGTRDLPHRHHTLQSAVQWSYNLLSEDERQLFRCLSVFVGGWTFEAADAVCSAGRARQRTVFDGLEILVDGNLLKPLEEEDGEPRLSMLDTIREYASEQLALSYGEQRAAQRRHAEYYLALAEQATTEIRGGRQLAWLDRLEREHGNMRAALDRSIEVAMPAVTLRLGAALWRFWAARGHYSEGRHWLDAASAILSAQDVDSIPNELRAAAFTAAGALALIQGDLRQARRCHQSALGLWRRVGHKQAIGMSLGDLGAVSMLKGSYTEAWQLLEESLHLLLETGVEADTVHALSTLGAIEMRLSHLDRALELHEAALAIYRRQEDKHGIARSLSSMGDVLQYQGDYGRAQSLLHESLDLAGEVRDLHGMAITHSSLGRVALAQKDAEQCRKHYIAGLTLLRDVGDRIAIASALEGLAAASCLQAQSEPPEGCEAELQNAAKLCAAAEALRRVSGAPLPPTDLASYQRTLTALETQLDEATLDEARGEGQGLTLEQAVELALEGNGGVTAGIRSSHPM